MDKKGELSEKERSLIAIGASVAAGCQPCTAHHVKAARSAGACNRSVAFAIETALAGRESAARVMGEWAAECQGERPEVDAEFRAQKQLISELTSIATAVAVNSVPDLQNHLSAAQKAGATPHQIRSAIEIARRIQRTAAEKVDAVTAALAEPAPVTAAAGSGCCGSAEPAGQAQGATGTSTCGCR